MKIKLRNGTIIIRILRILLMILVVYSLFLFSGSFSNRSYWNCGFYDNLLPSEQISPETELSQELLIHFYGSIDRVHLQLTNINQDISVNDQTQIKISIRNLRSNKQVDEVFLVDESLSYGWHVITLSDKLNVFKNDIVRFSVSSDSSSTDCAPSIWLLKNVSNGESIVSQAVSSVNGELSGVLSLEYYYTEYFFLSGLTTIFLVLLLSATIFIRIEIDNDEVISKPTNQHKSIIGHIIDINRTITTTLNKGKILEVLSCLLALLIIPSISFYILQTNVMHEKYTNIWSVLLPLSVFLLVSTIMFVATNKFAVSFILSNSLFLLLYITNVVKMSVRGDIFLASDMFAASEALEYADFNLLITAIDRKVIIFILILLLVAIVGNRKIKFKLQITKRIALALVSIFMFFVMIVNIMFNHSLLHSKFNIKNIREDQTRNMKENGYFQVFLMNSNVIFINKPNNYSKNRVDEIIASYSNKYQESSQVNVNKELPQNVIVIMNESFYDMRLLDQKYAKYDYMPYVSSIMSKYPSGYTVVPVIGGGTCNSEFEFLTGYSMAFLPQGSLPYQQFINRNHSSSIPNVFSKLNYITVATHPNSGRYWNRDYVYNKFGFDEFIDISLYSSLHGILEYNRGMYTDKSVYDVVLDKIKQNKERKFIFAVTIQNHIPYDSVGIEEVYNVVGDDELGEEFEIYLNLLRKSDDDIKYLISELEKLNENSVLLFFGDHAPALGLELYENIDESNILKKYSSPFFIYHTSNFNAICADELSNFPSYLSTNFLGFNLLDLLGIESGYYQNIVMNAMDENSVLSPFVERDIDSSAFLQDYEVIQYYNLFSKD